MQVSTSAYYAWVNSKSRPFDATNFKLKSIIKETFYEYKQTLGSRRMVIELAKKNVHVGRYKIRAMMRKLRLKARYPKRYL